VDAYRAQQTHYNYMVGPGYSDAPSPAAIRMVVDAPRAHWVTLHIDPRHTAIQAHRVIVPDWPSVTLFELLPSTAGTLAHLQPQPHPGASILHYGDKPYRGCTRFRR
jgi:hypothetical protein